MDPIQSDENEQLSYRSQYLPFGTFSFHLDASNQGALQEWTELDPSSLRGFAPPFIQELTHLLQLKWIRASIKVAGDDFRATLRIYVLPDDVGRARVLRSQGRPRNHLRGILSAVDRSSQAWNGLCPEVRAFQSYHPTIPENDSLFYIFNTLAPPNPTPEEIEDDLAAGAVQDVLDGRIAEDGLRTKLYPYQRRSAAAMVQRETQPKLALDPRLETWRGPTNLLFYLDRDKCEIFSKERLYPEVKGGILAETMGYGKTLICLVTILATKGYIPEIPPGLVTTFGDTIKRPEILSLAGMCAANIANNNIQWRRYFMEQERNGKHYKDCMQLLEHTIGQYAVPILRRRSRREFTEEPELQTIYLAPTTLVIVPPNLVEQWQREIQQHLSSDALSILILDNQNAPLPQAQKLGSYDLILMSGPRFEQELFPLGTNHTYEGDVGGSCCCEDPIKQRFCSHHLYRSPLRDVHFLRIIVDEGQRFVSTATTQAIQGLKIINVERKWLVSGTPAGGLVGAEVDLAAEGSFGANSDSPSLDSQSSDERTDETVLRSITKREVVMRGKSKIRENLIRRRSMIDLHEERKSVERLGHIVKSYLGVSPWANEDIFDSASWSTYIMPSKNGHRKPLSLRGVMASLVVRHQWEDVEADLSLPLLENKLVYLKPCFYDKVSINLFIFSLISNAVTSERTDQDYMFHPKNRKYLEALIKNLRHAGFTWSGFTPGDIEATSKLSKAYVENPEKKINEDDRRKLEEALAAANIAIKSPIWSAFHHLSEIGLYITNFPGNRNRSWALCPEVEFPPQSSLIAPSQLSAVQATIEDDLYLPDFDRTLKTISNTTSEATFKIHKASNPMSSATESFKKGKAGTKNVSQPGIPQSGIQEVKKLTENQFLNVAVRARTKQAAFSSSRSDGSRIQRANSNPGLKSVLKVTQREVDIPVAYPTISSTKLTGTSSAKLTYLVDRISALYQEEKILLFYEGDDIAFYCAQVLELLNIPHLIYASGIAQQLRNEYQTRFNTDDFYRVMLMDLKQAALGLHMASASRVFFINPVWQPAIEAQAIKRAHRIGQTKPVFVESLVLEGTLEEAMLRRRKAMTTDEHRRAARSLLDDQYMSELIQNASILPMRADEITNPDLQFAKLQRPQQLFGRSIVEAYGSHEAVMAAWSKSAPAQGHTEVAEPWPGALFMSQHSTNGVQNDLAPPRPSKKRKLNFVDEVERRKVMQSTSQLQSSNAGSYVHEYACDEAQEPSNKRLRRSKVHFADEKDLPLETIVFLPTTSPTPEPQTGGQEDASIFGM